MNGPLVQRILNFAHRTFSRFEGSGDVSENVSKLAELVKGFTVNEIKFNSDILDDNTKFDEALHEAPVGYVYLWDSPHFSMGIFIVRNGQRIPLHNHPDMHGIVKVIHGTAEIKSFSSLPEGKEKEPPESLLQSLRQWERSCVTGHVKHEPLMVTKDSDVCVLSPGDRNVHEISAPIGTIAFLDILAPKYDEYHVCSYYKCLEHESAVEEVEGPDGQKTCTEYLLQCPQPSEFHCQLLDYYEPVLEKPDDSPPVKS